MNELIKITEKNGSQVVSARELHTFLESKQDFSNWIKNRIKRYDLIENEDFVRFDKIIETFGGKSIEYAITLDTAKELSMVENNTKGKQARKYFIEAEKKLRSVFQLPATFSEALKLASQQAEQIEQQQLVISAQAPKVIAFENVIDSANTYTLDSVSDILNIGRTTLCRMLEEKKWKTIKETHGTSSTRYAEENGFAKTIYEYVKVGRVDIKTKRFVLKKKGLDKLLLEKQSA